MEGEMERTRVIEVLGVPVRARSYGCGMNGGPLRPVEGRLKLQLTIVPSSFCMAACPFCIAAPHDRRDAIDLNRLESMLVRLKDEGVVRGVSVTGGEPFMDVGRVDRIVSMVFGIFGYNMEITLDTNGCGIERLGEIRELSHVDTVHVSRHHYDDAVNFRLFGTRAVPDAATLRRAMGEISYRDLFVMNCMLLKDYIGTPEEARRYMDFAIQTGAGKVAFITGMPVNAYMARQRVDYRDVLRPDDPSLLFTRRFDDCEWCRCQDGVYCSSAGMMEFYGRSTDSRACDYCRGLVIGPDNRLRTGFNGAVIA